MQPTFFGRGPRHLGCCHSGNLDAETEAAVLQNILRLQPGKAVVISTHRPGALRLCRRIYRVGEGGITEVTDMETIQLLKPDTESSAGNRPCEKKDQAAAWLRTQETRSALSGVPELPGQENNTEEWWTL